MRFLVAVALILIPSAANAAPVYLKCQLDLGAEAGDRGDLAAKSPMDVTLNEEAGTVTYYFPDNNRAFTVRGVFRADKVTFNGFTIDRTNLEFIRDTLGDLSYGKCWFAEVKRAF